MDETTAEPAEGSVGNGGDWTPVPDEAPVDIPVEEVQEPLETIDPEQDLTRVAQEVIAGLWGRGHDRSRRLTEAGYDPRKVNFEMIKVFNR